MKGAEKPAACVDLLEADAAERTMRLLRRMESVCRTCMRRGGHCCEFCFSRDAGSLLAEMESGGIALGVIDLATGERWRRDASASLRAARARQSARERERKRGGR